MFHILQVPQMFTVEKKIQSLRCCLAISSKADLHLKIYRVVFELLLYAK